MRPDTPPPSKEDIAEFTRLIDKYRYDLAKLAYIIFPFGEKGTELEDYYPYDWQIEEWDKLSAHLQNPATRYDIYRLIISSGNGAAKTAFGAMTLIMFMFTQRLHCRITANTDPQMESVVWPEYDIWFRRARFVDFYFEKFGKSIKAKNPKDAEKWRIDRITWSEEAPAAISGLHNKGGMVCYTFEEAPGIPAVIWDYTRGAFTETGTIKLFMAFGNSDDPESKFEQNMASPLWNARRIDTRELSHIDKKFVSDLLLECAGNEDHDEFRVRVRGMPRKSSKDSIINLIHVKAALARRIGFDPTSVQVLPCVLFCDPAWRGGDDTTIGYQQGNYRCLLEKYKLAEEGDNATHALTYNRLVYWERILRADAVFIDQGEGTALYTLATNAGKTNWHLISFASNPNDNVDPKQSEYKNIRAQGYYETNKWLQAGGILDAHPDLIAKEPGIIDVIEKQLCWTKGGRHKVTQQKLAEAKDEIKARVGQSPDVADVLIMPSMTQVLERLPENEIGDGTDRFQLGGEAYSMPALPDPYRDEVLEVDYKRLYD